MMRTTNWRQLSLPFRRVRTSPAEDVALRSVAVAAPLEQKGISALEAHRLRITGYLTMHMPDPVEVTFTDNRYTMISFRKARGCYRVRLHKMFRHADIALLHQLVLFLTAPKKSASNHLDCFIAEHREEIDGARKRRTAALVAKGRHFDLDEVLTRVALQYFDGKAEVRIGWGAAPKRSRKRRYGKISRALATYSYEDKIIRVSPVLDAPNVPHYVIDWIVYHEMLHHVLPIIKKGSKNIYHSARFRSLERGFKHFEKAKAWEEKHMEELLR
jgi:hypothetical protein